jgi:rhodanese-related sulfurtransferase
MQEISVFLSNHMMLSMSIALLIVLLLIVEILRSKQKKNAVTPRELIQLMNHQNAVIFDIRPNDTFRKAHIIGAQSISSKDLQDNSKKIEKFKNRPIVIVCPAGIESQKIAAFLLKKEYNAMSLAGGMRAWVESGMPVVKE